MSESLEKNNSKTKKSKFKNISTYIMVILFIGCIIFMIAGTKAMKEHRLLSIFGYSYSVVPTDSMEPTIMVDDVVLIKNVEYSDLKIGDIIVYYNNEYNISVVHRIIKIFNDGTFETKGDNNSSSDGIHITNDIYQGKVISYGNFLGLGKLINNGRSIIFILIIIIFIFLIVSEIFNIITILKEQQAKKCEDEQELKKQELSAIREKLKEEVLKELEDEEYSK